MLDPVKEQSGAIFQKEMNHSLCVVWEIDLGQQRAYESCIWENLRMCVNLKVTDSWLPGKTGCEGFLQT